MFKPQLVTLNSMSLTKSLCAAAICVLLFFLKATAEDSKLMQLANLAQQRYGAEAYANFVALDQLVAAIKNSSDIEKLNKINNFFNERILFVNDIDLWNTSDYWATPLETLGRKAGDCEDFSIAKYAMLRLAGIADDKLRLVYVKASLQGDGRSYVQAHMVLSYYATPLATPLVLDNLNPDILPANQRKDLIPIFSFNSSNLWVGSSAKPNAKATTNLSRWQSVLNRMSADGFN